MIGGRPFVLRSLLALTAGCSRPADPSEPLVVEVQFQSRGVTLAGTVHFPSTAARVPGVVLVHGSGPVTRDGNGPLIAPLLGQGLAVLAYDKRGTGQSGGQYRGVGPLNSDSMIDLLGADAAAALAALARQPRVDPARLGLAGGSQAGWIIPRAAVLHPVRFAVILSGPLVSVGEEVYFSAAFENSTLPLSKVDSVLATFRGPTGYDPVADLRQVQADIFWLFGALDRSIPAPRSAKLASDLAASLGRDQWRVDLLPNRDHSLTDVGSGQPLDLESVTKPWLAGVIGPRSTPPR